MIGNHVDSVSINNLLRLLPLGDVVILLPTLSSGRSSCFPLRLLVGSGLAHRFSDGDVQLCLHFFSCCLSELALSILLRLFFYVNLIVFLLFFFLRFCVCLIAAFDFSLHNILFNFLLFSVLTFNHWLLSHWHIANRSTLEVELVVVDEYIDDELVTDMDLLRKEV